MSLRAAKAWLAVESAIRCWQTCTQSTELPIEGYDHENLRDAVALIRSIDCRLRFPSSKKQTNESTKQNSSSAADAKIEDFSQ